MAGHKHTSDRTRDGNDNSGGAPKKDRLRLALVGCGGMGRCHAMTLLNIPEVEVVAICDVVESKMGDFQREFYAPRGLEPARYANYNQMLERERLDAVVLVTPHVCHYPQARDALLLDLHVLSEKPMVTNSEHARKLVALAEQRGRVLAIAFQAPVSCEYAYIRNLIRRGDLGELKVVNAFLAQNWCKPMTGTWRQDPEISGGGELYDSGAHMLNGMMWLVDAPVKRVFAILDNCGTPVDINATVSIMFANGCLASVSCAGCSTLGIDSGLTIYGTRGTVKTGIWGGVLEHYDAGGERVRYPYVPYPPLTPERNFVDALLGRDELRCPGRYGVLLAELMDAVYESVRTGSPVEVQHRMTPSGEARHGRGR